MGAAYIAGPRACLTANGAQLLAVAKIAAPDAAAWFTCAPLIDRRNRRRQDCRDGLGDVIELLAEGFRAGNALQAAFKSVAQCGSKTVRQD